MEHEHVTLQSSEDYQELFERFLSAVGISPAEFKAYLAASVPHCGALRTVKNGLAAETADEGIFLSVPCQDQHFDTGLALERQIRINHQEDHRLLHLRLRQICHSRKWKNIWQYTTPACLQRQS